MNDKSFLGSIESGFDPKKEISEAENYELPGITIKGVAGEMKKVVENEIARRSKKQEEYTRKFYDKVCQDSSVFDGFLELLREKEIPVSTPEWMQFIKVVQEKTKPEELENNDQLLNTIRLYAKIILVKNKGYETSFHEAFDEYFQSLKKIFEREILEDVDIKSKKDGPEEDPEDLKNDIVDQKERDGETEPDIKDQLGIDDTKENDDSSDDNIETNDFDNDEEERDSETEPDIKDELGIQDAEENLDTSKSREESEDEQIHGGKKDQHNDILKKADLSKKSGGSKKDEDGGEGNKGKASEGKGDKGAAGKGKGDKGDPSGIGKGSDEFEENDNKVDYNRQAEEGKRREMIDKGTLVGGSKGNFKFAEKNRNYIVDGERIKDEMIEAREKEMKKVDQRSRYEKRPDRASMREIIKNLRRIITDVSDVKSKKINTEKTVRNFAKKDFRFEYEREREKQPEIVLLIDVGGPVDEWSPLIKEVAESMTKGLTKLEIYLFHNNLYGYVWKPDLKDFSASNYAKPNSLIDIKSIVKKRKKTIIYGDAEMSNSEFESDGWPPQDNDERIDRFGMHGDECLKYIEKKSDSAVWINPIFKKEWEERDDSGTIKSASDIMSMHDLTVGGVEDAVKELMKK